MSAQGNTTIGVDLGGTKVNGVVLDASGAVLARVRLAHQGQDLLEKCALVVDSLRDRPGLPRPARIGLAVAGLVDRTGDELLEGALIGIRRSNLHEFLTARVGLPLTLENDANATLAGVHLRTPAPQRGEVVVLVALGTGVGGALSVGGEIVAGSHGLAGEFGHIPLGGPDSPACPCGSRGCLELIASGPAVASSAGADDGEELIDRARRAEPRAVGALDDAGQAIGRALLALVSSLDPGVIYLSGGFGHAAAPWLIPAIEVALNGQRSFAAVKPSPRIVVDPVGPIAAALGAAQLAQQAQLAVAGATVLER